MLVRPFRVIHYTHLDDQGPGDTFQISYKRGAAIRTEVIGDLVPPVCDFGYGLESTFKTYQCQVLETCIPRGSVGGIYKPDSILKFLWNYIIITENPPEISRQSRQWHNACSIGSLV